MIAGMRSMFSDVEKRGGVNGFNKIEYMDIKAEEIKDGLIYDRGGMKVSAFKVSHGDGDPATSGTRSNTMAVWSCYRAIRSPVRTWSRRPKAPIFSFTTWLASAMDGLHGPVRRSIGLRSHPSSHRRSRSRGYFREAKPRLAAISHIVKKDLSGKAGDDFIVAQIRKDGYTGPMLMGEDRTVIDIDGADIKVTPPRPTEESSGSRQWQGEAGRRSLTAMA